MAKVTCKSVFTSKAYSVKTSAIRAAKRDHAEAYEATQAAGKDREMGVEYIGYREMVNGTWVYEVIIMTEINNKPKKETTKKETTKSDNERYTKKEFSDIESPCRRVWVIAESMEGARRKEVIEACVANGIAYNTARTQYQHWSKAKKNDAAKKQK